VGGHRERLDVRFTTEEAPHRVTTRIRSSQLEALGAIARVTSAGKAPNECALEVLEELRSVIPYECAELADYDPVSSAPGLLANSGYSDDLITCMHGRVWEQSGDELGIRTTGEPLLMGDVPSDSLAERLVEDFLLPAGFAGGMTMFLVTSDHRCVGMLNLSTTDRRHPTAGERTMLRCINQALANAVDPLRFPSSLVGSIDREAAAVVVTRDQMVAPLPGRRSAHYLDSGSPLVAAAFAALADRRRNASFLWRDADKGWLQVNTFVTSDDGPGRESRVVILAVSTAPPYDLTTRELEVLSLLASGYSNARIASTLVVSRRTVSTHVEHIFEKLGVASRAAAASRAASEGFLLGRVAERVLVAPRSVI